jgi:uncharacterized protein with NRDE domain
MCVLAIAWSAHPRWRLVLAGNRDELHSRPARPLARWSTPPHLLAGKDLMSGGTWLGVSEQGRIAVVTNLRGFGAARLGLPSRGILLKDMLAGEGEYTRPSDTQLMEFNAFNVIEIESARATFLSNRPSTVRQLLTPGVYGLSNGALDAPWPKTVQLKTILSDWMAGCAQKPKQLLDGLREDVLPLVGDGSAVPSDISQEAAISPIFIKNPVYGTRCSTVVAVDDLGRGQIAERRFDAEGNMSGETMLDFSWPI